MLKLHDYVLSAECYTVRLMLALLSLPHERIAVDAYPGNADCPVLIDGDDIHRDPGLILTFLARSHSPQWLPHDEAREIAGWLAFTATRLNALAEARRVAVMGTEGDLDALNAKGRAALRMLEDTLTERGIAGRHWLVGTSPTIADIAVFPHVMLSHDSGIGHEDYPAINLWQRRVRKIPGFIGMPGIPDYF
ncbi:MAG: glutathione S-transferase C-terminal domain-containing protein [Devosia sp.]